MGWPNGMSKFEHFNPGNGTHFDVVQLTAARQLWLSMKERTWDGDILRGRALEPVGPYAVVSLDVPKITELRDALTRFLEQCPAQEQ